MKTVTAIAVALSLFTMPTSSVFAMTQLSLDGGVSWLPQSRKDLIPGSSYPGESFGVSLGKTCAPHSAWAFLVRHSAGSIGSAPTQPTNPTIIHYGNGLQTSTAIGGVLTFYAPEISNITVPHARFDFGLLAYHTSYSRSFEGQSFYHTSAESNWSIAGMLGIGADLPLWEPRGRLTMNVGVSWCKTFQSLDKTTDPPFDELSVRLGLTQRWD